jgi:hypothetical protein
MMPFHFSQAVSANKIVGILNGFSFIKELRGPFSFFFSCIEFNVQLDVKMQVFCDHPLPVEIMESINKKQPSAWFLEFQVISTQLIING